ncbi:MAG: DUF6048 family protein [Bacteroidaceae bacterium]|nr:DUF6048 family protein [Bacteroidaceae bacterium]
MNTMRIYACLYILWLISLCAGAQEERRGGGEAPNDSTAQIRGIQFVHDSTPSYSDMPTFCGISIGADVAGIVRAQVAKFGEYEAQARFNFKQRYFLAAEVGLGTSNYTSERSHQHYRTHSPYFRVGGDYNFARNPVSGNRIYLGLRYGFSSFKFDIDGPDFYDPVWRQSLSYHLHGISSKMHWGELVAGLEGRLWRFIHLGWSVRWKFRFKQTGDTYGNPYYVPGYGNNTDGTCFGGNFTVLLDISDIKNSKKRKQ